MPYKYQIEKGQESRIFANARNLGDGTVESDTELSSPWLTLVNDKSTPPAANDSPVTPSATPPIPQTQAVNPVPPAQTQTNPNQETK